MPTVLTHQPTMETRTRRERLLPYLQAYWLRPENALWMMLRSHVQSAVAMKQPTADLSCGDGIYSFLHHGGRLAPDFDVFQAVTSLDRVHENHADMFDGAVHRYDVKVVAAADCSIGIGTDLKPSMLAKADALELYDRLVRHDNNHPLPFQDDTFETIYCNSTYWLDNIDGFLGELARITRPSGRVVLHVKLDAVRQYTLNAHRAMLGDRFLDIIGRGRIESWPSLADRRTWEKRFAHAGLSIREATPFITSSHAHLWDIGLRPIAPLLVRMANALTPHTRADIKRDWVSLLTDLLEPMCDAQWNLSSRDSEPAEIQYVLQPR